MKRSSRRREDGRSVRSPEIGTAMGGGSVSSVDATDDPVDAGPAISRARSVRPISITSGLDMDPRLQKLLAMRRGGETTPVTASSAPGEVPVIGLVTDARAWTELSEVRAGVYIGGVSGEAVVTGRIPLDRVEAVRRLPFVKSLKAAHPLKLALAAGIRETRADPASLGAGLSSRGGSGVVVGVIDFGCDFQHRNFRTAAGQTRLEAIWHQGGGLATNGPFGYGRIYERTEIDAALRQGRPYEALGYGPARDTRRSQGTHGTHVMDIAAGNGNGSGVPGFAPEAALIFVDVSSDDIAWSGPEVIETSFGDSVRLLEAVRFIFDRAGERPCVVNISLGTNGGPHDGTTLVERGLDELVRERPNRAIVIAASNSYADGIHASGTVEQGGTLEVGWNRPPSSGWQDELEFWYSGDERFDVELLMPDGTSLGVVAPGEKGEAQDEDGRVAVLIASRLHDPNNGSNTIGIYVDDGQPSGRWSVRLTGRQVASGAFHAWIERDDNSQASFLTNRDDGCTIGSISCGREVVVVGSYDAHKESTPLSYFSSAGPTRDGREKPDLSAPGHAVVAAHSRTTDKVTVKSGTSMAAPAVSGALALLLGEASARSVELTAQQSRDLLRRTARRVDNEIGWHPRWGAGRLDVAASFAGLPAAAPTAAPSPGAVAATISMAQAPQPPARRRGRKSGKSA